MPTSPGWRRLAPNKTTVLERKARVLAQSLAACQRLIKASLGRVRLTCGKPACRCAKGQRFHHEALNFTYKLKGQGYCLHVPKGMENEACRAATDYARLKKIVQALSNANLQKFRHKIQTLKSKSRK